MKLRLPLEMVTGWPPPTWNGHPMTSSHLKRSPDDLLCQHLNFLIYIDIAFELSYLYWHSTWPLLIILTLVIFIDIAIGCLNWFLLYIDTVLDPSYLYWHFIIIFIDTADGYLSIFFLSLKNIILKNIKKKMNIIVEKTNKRFSVKSKYDVRLLSVIQSIDKKFWDN